MDIKKHIESYELTLEKNNKINSKELLNAFSHALACGKVNVEAAQEHLLHDVAPVLNEVADIVRKVAYKVEVELEKWRVLQSFGVDDEYFVRAALIIDFDSAVSSRLPCRILSFSYTLHKGQFRICIDENSPVYSPQGMTKALVRQHVEAFIKEVFPHGHN